MNIPTNLSAVDREQSAMPDDLMPKNIAIYITDQSHPAQRARLPENAIPGYGVSVYRLKGRRPATMLESMWCRTKAQAEQMAQEYARQYATMAACGWR